MPAPVLGGLAPCPALVRNTTFMIQGQCLLLIGKSCDSSEYPPHPLICNGDTRCEVYVTCAVCECTVYAGQCLVLPLR